MYMDLCMQFLKLQITGVGFIIVLIMINSYNEIKKGN